MTVQKPKRTIGHLLFLAAFLGCGGRGGDAPPQSAKLDAAEEVASQPAAAVRDACSLITKAEVDAILRASVTVEPKRKTGWSECHYQAGPGGTGFSMKVYWSNGPEELTTTRTAMGIAPKAMRDKGVDAGGMMVLQPVEDLGDEAYFNPIVGSYVLQGDVLMEFDLRLLQAPSRDSAMALWRDLAGKAAARL